jgi:hypothetical protein
MQRTADFHDPIADAWLPKTVGVVDDATALHAAVDVLEKRMVSMASTNRTFFTVWHFFLPL